MNSQNYKTAKINTHTHGHTSVCDAASASSVILLTKNLPELSTIELTGNYRIINMDTTVDDG